MLKENFATAAYMILVGYWGHQIRVYDSSHLENKIVGFLGKKPQTFMIPIYSTTVLYVCCSLH